MMINLAGKEYERVAEIDGTVIFKDEMGFFLFEHNYRARNGDYAFPVQRLGKSVKELVEILPNLLDWNYRARHGEEEYILGQEELLKGLMENLNEKQAIEKKNDVKNKERKLNNSVLLQGIITENTEVKITENGKKYINIPLEMENEYNGKTSKQIFNISMFDENADNAAQFHQGDSVLIRGHLYNNKYKDKITLTVVGDAIEKGDVGSKNTLKISGFINNKKLELKTNEQGNKSLTVALSVKNKYGDGYGTFFANAYGKTAEIISQYEQHDLVEIQGSVKMNEQGVLNILTYRSQLVRKAVNTSNSEKDQHANSKIAGNGGNDK